MPDGLRAPDFSLRDQDGERVSMRALRGRPVIVTFLYTTCEETCPAQAQQIKIGLDRLGRDVPALAIAVKPSTDTPTNANRFLVEQGMVGRMDIALGTRPELEQVWKGFAIQPQLEGVDHPGPDRSHRRERVPARGLPARSAHPGTASRPTCARCSPGASAGGDGGPRAVSGPRRALGVGTTTAPGRAPPSRTPGPI